MTFANGALQAAIVTDAAAPLQHMTFEEFRTRPADPKANPTTLVFVPNGMGGVSAVRVYGVTFARARGRN